MASVHSSKSSSKRLKTESLPELKNVENISDDGIWGSDDEFRSCPIGDDDFYGERPIEPETAEIASLRRIHAKLGYLDGIATKKEESLQEGFDSGYPAGAEIGKRVGKILETLQCLAALSYSDAVDLMDDAKQELHLRKVLSNRYFDENLEVKQLHPVIEDWEEKIEKLLHEFKS